MAVNDTFSDGFTTKSRSSTGLHVISDTVFSLYRWPPEDNRQQVCRRLYLESAFISDWLLSNTGTQAPFQGQVTILNQDLGKINNLKCLNFLKTGVQAESIRNNILFQITWGEVEVDLVSTAARIKRLLKSKTKGPRVYWNQKTNDRMDFYGFFESKFKQGNPR